MTAIRDNFGVPGTRPERGITEYGVAKRGTRVKAVGYQPLPPPLATSAFGECFETPNM